MVGPYHINDQMMGHLMLPCMQTMVQCIGNHAIELNGLYCRLNLQQLLATHDVHAWLAMEVHKGSTLSACSVHMLCCGWITCYGTSCMDVHGAMCICIALSTCAGVAAQMCADGCRGVLYRTICPRPVKAASQSWICHRSDAGGCVACRTTPRMQCPCIDMRVVLLQMSR